MNKQFLWISLVLLIGYLALVFCDENDENLEKFAEKHEIETQSKELFDEARTRRRHKFFHLFWGWHALAIAYWIKVKVVIVAFFLGSAVFLGLRHFWPHKCKPEISHEGPIIYDNPHIFSHHHDHIPYALEHSEHIDHSFEPGVELSSPPEGHHHVKRRSILQKTRQIQAMNIEEQLAELMFSFLGLDSKACRRRFICEMEFRSKRNPISSMGFRIVGRGFFEKYTNARNTHGRANSFYECAVVNPECVFIEQADEGEKTSEENITAETTNNNSENYSTSENEQTGIDDKQNDIEAENEANLAAERHHINRRRRTNIRERFFSKRT